MKGLVVCPQPRAADVGAPRRPRHVGVEVAAPAARMRIEDVKVTKRGDHRVVRTKHVLLNQDDERVLPRDLSGEYLIGDESE